MLTPHVIDLIIDFVVALAGGWMIGFMYGRTWSRRLVEKWTGEALAEATAEMDRRRAAWATRTVREIVDAKRDGKQKGDADAAR